MSEADSQFDSNNPWHVMAAAVLALIFLILLFGCFQMGVR
jgi:hypothetical protein